MWQEVEVLYQVQGHPLLIPATVEVMVLLQEVPLTHRDMIEVLHLLITEARVLLTTDPQCLATIHVLPLLLTTEVLVRPTILMEALQADLLTTIHHLTALQVDQIQATQEAAALVRQVEALAGTQVVGTQEEVLPEDLEEEGGINSPLFFG